MRQRQRQRLHRLTTEPCETFVVHKTALNKGATNAGLLKGEEPQLFPKEEHHCHLSQAWPSQQAQQVRHWTCFKRPGKKHIFELMTEKNMVM